MTRKIIEAVSTEYNHAVIANMVHKIAHVSANDVLKYVETMTANFDEVAQNNDTLLAANMNFVTNAGNEDPAT